MPDPDAPGSAADPLADLYSADPGGGGATLTPALYDPLADDLAAIAPDMTPLPAAPAFELDPYLTECVALEPIALSEEFARLPSDYARWNELLAEAHHRYLAAALHTRRTRARITLAIRRDPAVYAALYKCKITEGAIGDIVALDREVRAAEDAEAAADRDRSRVRGVLSAMARKSEALVTIGAHQRAELTLTPHIRSQPR